MRLPEALSKTLTKVLDALFPPVCVSCKTAIQRQDDFLCARCFDAISINTAFVCPFCSHRVVSFTGRCHPNVPFLLAPATSFDGPIQSLIHAYKYNHMQPIHLFCAALCIVHLSHLAHDISGYTVVPIPLYPSRLRQRGFNQATEIALHVARYFSLPYSEALVRSRPTPPQARTASFEERLENMCDVFDVADVSLINKKSIILVDDVFTSGATMRTATSTLKKAGAQHIVGLVVAKTL